ncbi:MAG: hypothetical protein PHC97_00670 [Patescibacteria group bacterium]|nr:hypothetical protein [Patescibacteria group bacterium]
MKKTKIIIVLLASLSALLLSAKFALAQSNGILLPACVSTGDCSLCDIIQTVINIGRFVIGIIGSIIFIYFVYGGIYMLASHGNPAMVSKGKNILVNSVIGLTIVILAYTIVNFAVLAATGGQIQNARDYISKNLTCTAPTK